MCACALSTRAVRAVHQAYAYRYDWDWERGRLTLVRWRVYEFVYVVDNKNDHPIDHFYLEVRLSPLLVKHFNRGLIW